MAITPTQQQTIIDAHALSYLDPEIAALAGVSISTVKRYRKKFGLETNCETARRGKLGERIFSAEAQRQGFEVRPRKNDNDSFDLWVAGLRVEVKTALQGVDGAWRLRLTDSRPSFYGQYSYTKDYAADCDVVAFVCLHPFMERADIYLVESRFVSHDLRIRPGGDMQRHGDAWGLFGELPLLQAA